MTDLIGGEEVRLVGVVLDEDGYFDTLFMPTDNVFLPLTILVYNWTLEDARTAQWCRLPPLWPRLCHAPASRPLDVCTAHTSITCL
jgi:hypothetical protein